VIGFWGFGASQLERPTHWDQASLLLLLLLGLSDASVCTLVTELRLNPVRLRQRWWCLGGAVVGRGA
jgi:hypothetical protein